MDEPAFLVVARILKPHGLKGEALVESLTDQPETVLAVGRRLTPVSDRGEDVGSSLTVARSRRQKGGWLLGFVGIESRADLEQRSLRYLGARREELRPLQPNAMYRHEIPGAQVVERGAVIGVARELVGATGAELLVVEANGREHLIPFRAPILKGLDRAGRRIEVELPPGLLEL